MAKIWFYIIICCIYYFRHTSFFLCWNRYYVLYIILLIERKNQYASSRCFSTNSKSFWCFFSEFELIYLKNSLVTCDLRIFSIVILKLNNVFCSLIHATKFKLNATFWIILFFITKLKTVVPIEVILIGISTKFNGF